MKTKIYLLLIIGIIISSCENDSDDLKTDFQLETPDELTELEYELYSLILNRDFKSSDLTIYQKTSINNKDNPDNIIKSDDFINIEDSTIESYYNLNSKEYVLDNQISFDNGKISMISSSDYDYFFKEQNDNQNWINFYKYFPNSFGLIQFSRIGFNNDLTQAIVNYKRSDKNGNGEFRIYYLDKIDKNWEIQIYLFVIAN